MDDTLFANGNNRKKLAREQALVHPRLPECWDGVDYLLVNDRELHSHVYVKDH